MVLASMLCFRRWWLASMLCFRRWWLASMLCFRRCWLASMLCFRRWWLASMLCFRRWWLASRATEWLWAVIKRRWQRTWSSSRRTRYSIDKCGPMINTVCKGLFLFIPILDQCRTILLLPTLDQYEFVSIDGWIVPSGLKNIHLPFGLDVFCSVVVHCPVFLKHKDRPNVLLVGDHTADVQMAGNVKNPETILKIGFLNEKVNYHNYNTGLKVSPWPLSWASSSSYKVKPLLSGHPRDWANWLLNTGWPLNRRGSLVSRLLEGRLVEFRLYDQHRVHITTPTLWYHSCHILVYTTQVNSAFRAIWLVPQSRDIKYYSPPGSFRRKKMVREPFSSENKATIWELLSNLCRIY